MRCFAETYLGYLLGVVLSPTVTLTGQPHHKYLDRALAYSLLHHLQRVYAKQ